MYYNDLILFLTASIKTKGRKLLLSDDDDDEDEDDSEF